MIFTIVLFFLINSINSYSQYVPDNPILADLNLVYRRNRNEDPRFLDPLEFGDPSVVHPGDRYRYASWTYNKSIFCGFGYSGTNVGYTGSQRSDEYTSHLFEFDTLKKQWCFRAGVLYQNDTFPAANYGVVEKEYGPDVMPGGRISPCQFANEDKLYLMGGFAYVSEVKTGRFVAVYANDIWEYDVANNTWRWVRDNRDFQSYESVWGPNHDYDPSYFPSGRRRHFCMKGRKNAAYMFGGRQIGNDPMGDLWEYNITTEQWRYLKGTPNDRNIGGVVGFYDEFDVDSFPPGREWTSGWTRVVDGHVHLFIFGGHVDYRGANAIVEFGNDLWEYSSNEELYGISGAWRIRGGNFETHSPGRYDAYGYYTSKNYPGSRQLHQAYMVEHGQKVVIYGGLGVGETDFTYSYLNDVWVYDYEENLWSWIGGSRETRGAGNFLDEPKDFWGYHSGGSRGYELDGKMYVFNGLALYTDYTLRVFTGRIPHLATFAFNYECGNLTTLDNGICNHRGVCIKHWDWTEENKKGYCECQEDYEGDTCEVTKHKCKGLLASKKEVCSSHGDCLREEETGKGKCKCSTSSAYFGTDCQENIYEAYVEIKKVSKKKKQYYIIVKHVTYEDLILESSETSFNCSERVVEYGLLGENPLCEWKFDGNWESPKSEHFNISLGTGGFDLKIDGKGKLTIKAISTNESITLKVAFDFIDPWEEFNQLLEEIFLENLGYWLTGLIFILIFLCVLISILTFFCIKSIIMRARVVKVDKLKNVDLLLLEQQAEKGKIFDTLHINQDLFDIPFEKIKLLKVIASGGSSATIYKAEYNKMVVAFKCFKTRDISSQDHVDAFEKEVSVLSSMRHEGLLLFYGCALNPPRIGIVTQFCNLGDLRTYIVNDDNPRLLIKEKLVILRRVAETMAYLNSKSIIHRDLKSENVLLTEKLEPKLIDFGLSRVVEGNVSSYLTKQAGTSTYMAPEVTLGGKYGAKCDVFSFAIVMHEVLTENFFPYGTAPEFNIELKVALNADFRPGIEESKYPNLKWYMRLMKQCWSGESEDRPAFKEIGEIFEEKIEDTLYAMQKAAIKEVESTQEEEKQEESAFKYDLDNFYDSYVATEGGEKKEQPKDDEIKIEE